MPIHLQRPQTCGVFKPRVLLKAGEAACLSRGAVIVIVLSSKTEEEEDPPPPRTPTLIPWMKGGGVWALLSKQLQEEGEKHLLSVFARHRRALSLIPKMFS